MLRTPAFKAEHKRYPPLTLYFPAAPGLIWSLPLTARLFILFVATCLPPAHSSALTQGLTSTHHSRDPALFLNVLDASPSPHDPRGSGDHSHLLTRSLPSAPENCCLLVIFLLWLLLLSSWLVCPFTNLSEADAPQSLSLVLGLSNFTLDNPVDMWFPGPPSADGLSGSRAQIQCLLVSHGHPECQVVEKSIHC